MAIYCAIYSTTSLMSGGDDITFRFGTLLSAQSTEGVGDVIHTRI